MYVHKHANNKHLNTSINRKKQSQKSSLEKKNQNCNTGKKNHKALPHWKKNHKTVALGKKNHRIHRHTGKKNSPQRGRHAEEARERPTMASILTRITPISETFQLLTQQKIMVGQPSETLGDEAPITRHGDETILRYGVSDFFQSAVGLLHR